MKFTSITVVLALTLAQLACSDSPTLDDGSSFSPPTTSPISTPASVATESHKSPTPTSTPSHAPVPVHSETPVPVLTPTHTAAPLPSSSKSQPAQSPTKAPVILVTPALSTPTPNPCVPLSLSMPPACTPFSSLSPFNLTVAQQGATVSPNSATWQAYYNANPSTSSWFKNIQFGYTNQNNQFQHTIYISTAADPLVSVSCDAPWSDPCTNIGTNTFHVPTYARPANISSGSDAHMTEIDTATNNELDTWGTNDWNPGNPVTNGVLHAASGGYSPLSGEGLGYGPDGAGFALWAGVIRAPEFANVTPQINHALFIVAPCTNNNAPVYPSIWRASTDTECPGNQGAPYGAYGHLNLTAAQVNALPIVGADEKAIIMALAIHGGYVGDTDGNNGFSIQFEADPTYSYNGASYSFAGTGCPTNGAPCTPLTAFENHWGNPDWQGDRYSIDLSALVNFGTTWVWLNPPTPR